jgi:hypothetical protein
MLMIRGGAFTGPGDRDRQSPVRTGRGRADVRAVHELAVLADRVRDDDHVSKLRKMRNAHGQREQDGEEGAPTAPQRSSSYRPAHKSDSADTMPHRAEQTADRDVLEPRITQETEVSPLR